MGRPTILLIKETYYPILAAVGVPANLVTMVIIFRANCGLSKCISVYMVAMAAADLLVMIFNVIVYHVLSYHFQRSSLHLTPVCKLILYLTVVTLDLSVWFTVSFTFDRFVVICCQKFKTKYCTGRTAIALVTTFSVLIFLKNITFLFAYEPQQIIKKVQWGCGSSVSFFSSTPGAAFFWFHIVWVVWLPFAIIFLCNSLTISRILAASRARSGFRSHTSDNPCDPAIQNRRKSIILLFTISVSFILLWVTAVVSFAAAGLTNINYYRGDRTNPTYIATETGTMLKLLSSCVNPCIYAATQRKFREELQKLLKYPWELILKLFKSKINSN